MGILTTLRIFYSFIPFDEWFLQKIQVIIRIYVETYIGYILIYMVIEICNVYGLS